MKESQESLLTQDLGIVWSNFGGPKGDFVDRPQIELLLLLESQTRNFEVKTLWEAALEKRRAIPSIILRFLTKEVRRQYEYCQLVQELNTEEGRLEAVLFFARKRADLRNGGDSLMGEGQRRIVACGTAIDFLLS